MPISVGDIVSVPGYEYHRGTYLASYEVVKIDKGMVGLREVELHYKNQNSVVTLPGSNKVLTVAMSYFDKSFEDRCSEFVEQSEWLFQRIIADKEKYGIE